jgi:hypothetical protein
MERKRKKEKGGKGGQGRIREKASEREGKGAREQGKWRKRKKSFTWYSNPRDISGRYTSISSG